MYQWFFALVSKNENFEFWQVISHMFMHGGFCYFVQYVSPMGLWVLEKNVGEGINFSSFIFRQGIAEQP